MRFDTPWHARLHFGVLFLPRNVSYVVFSCQMERNLQDAMQVARNVMVDPRLVPGGGALEMALAQFLSEKSKVDRVAVVPQTL